MPLPRIVIEAHDRMHEAENELRADIDSAHPIDLARRRTLVENLQRRIQEYEYAVAELLPHP
jgi:F0F1-type ATP synthase delta subunit